MIIPPQTGKRNTPRIARSRANTSGRRWHDWVPAIGVACLLFIWLALPAAAQDPTPTPEAVPAEVTTVGGETRTLNPIIRDVPSESHLLSPTLVDSTPLKAPSSSFSPLKKAVLYVVSGAGMALLVLLAYLLVKRRPGSRRIEH